MTEDRKDRGFIAGIYPPPQEHPSSHMYGTFQGVANYPPQPAIGFPQPAPPPGASATPPPPPQYYAHGYQTVPGYAIVDGLPVRERRLPCCGIGMGWFLFIFGFFIAGIPWYAGAFVILCVRSIDYREKPGYVACTLAAVLATIVILFGATTAQDRG